jgi:hypothetical protein
VIPPSAWISALRSIETDKFGGPPLAITAAGRLVAITTVALDGTFRARAKRTKSSARLRDQARVADERSPALRATRLLIIDSQTATGGGVRVRGHLVSRRRAHRTLAVGRQLGCSATATRNAKTPRTDGRGRFSVVLPQPPPGELIAVYRLRTTSGGSSYTLPLRLRPDRTGAWACAGSFKETSMLHSSTAASTIRKERRAAGTGRLTFGFLHRAQLLLKDGARW